MQYTKALLHFDDTSNPLKDEIKTNIWTTAGNPRITSDNAKFGTGVTWNAGGGIVSTFPLGGQSFTVECWTKPTSYTSNGPYFTIYNSESNFVTPEVVGGWYYNCYNSISMNTGTNLNHVAVSYDHTTRKLYMFLNGVAKYTGTTSLYTNRLNHRVGFGLALWHANRPSNAFGGENHYTVGTWDEIRISDGIARYTSNFTPPTQQFIYGPYAEFPKTITGTYDKSPNGLKYCYRVRFEQGPWTETSNVVNYVTEHKRRQPWAA